MGILLMVLFWATHSIALPVFAHVILNLGEWLGWAMWLRVGIIVIPWLILWIYYLIVEHSARAKAYTDRHSRISDFLTLGVLIGSIVIVLCFLI
jgi:hypothetical protein